MKILVFGRNGQLARSLAQVHSDVTTIGHNDIDFLDAAAVRSCIEDSQAEAVINAAAFTAVDRAETELEVANDVNGKFPGILAQECKNLNIPMLHVSCSYVFDGSLGRSYREDDLAEPINAYGRTKLDGEKAVLDCGGRAIVARTSSNYSRHGSNFLTTMLRLGAERDTLHIVDDQRSNPTSTEDLAEALIQLAKQSSKWGKPEVLHVASRDAVTWAEFAEAIFSYADMSVKVVRIESAEYPAPASRPVNTSLDCKLLFERYGLTLPDWRSSVSKTIQNLTTESNGVTSRAKVSLVRKRIEENRLTILIVISDQVRQLSEFREKVAQNNWLGAENPDFRDQLLSFIDQLTENLTGIGKSLPDAGASNDEEFEAVASWFARFEAHVSDQLQSYIAPDNVAAAVLPVGIVLGCGAIGSLLGGPIGFGAGSFVGQYVTGHLKPGALSKKISDAIEENTKTD